MKRSTIIYLLCLLVVSSCTEDKSILLKGKIGNLDSPAKLYLSYFVDDEEHNDSTFFNKGNFSFEGSLEYPATSRLILDYTGDGMIPAAQAGNILYLYLDKGTVKIKSPDSLQNIVFVKSPINDENKRYLQAIGGQVQDISKRMNEKYSQAPEEQRADTAFMNGLNREYRKLLDERINKQKQYIKDNPNSFLSLFAISETNVSKDNVDEIEPLFLAIDAKYRETSTGKAFAQRISAAKNIQIGKKAPDFTQNDPNGNPIKLSDFQGKYLLIDFWASWCGPCRQENPNVVKAYAEYKDKGFEILGVSLDYKDGKEAWLAAIEKDGLTWPQVSDLKGWNNAVSSMYGVRAVPQNYLLDPQGIIIAENLRGDALGNFLKDIFNKK